MSRSKRNAAAEEYFRRAPNYSADAIPDLSERVRWHQKKGNGEAASLYEYVVEKLEAAHKFSLPEGGLLFAETRGWMLNGQRPPFPVSAFEFLLGSTPQSGVFMGGSKTAKVKREIVLSVREEPLTILFPIIETDGGWQLPLWFPMLHDEETVFYGPGEAPAGTRFHGPEDARERGFITVGIKFHRLGEPAKQLIDEYGLDEAEINRRAMRGSFHSISAYAQACAALSCTNVSTEVIRPNREARAARPASTLFDYHVLMIDPGREHPPGEALGGTHASPRTHLRRGHIRRLAWGPRVWVNSCVVNPSAIGTVNKDYAVRPVNH